MNCIYPGCIKPTKVMATRQPGANIITRRRECAEQHRFTTVDTVKGLYKDICKVAKTGEPRTR